MTETAPKKYSRNELDKARKYELGTTAFSEVYLIYHTSLRRFVVIKLIITSGDQETVRKKLDAAEEEAKIPAGFNHENLCRF